MAHVSSWILLLFIAASTGCLGTAGRDRHSDRSDPLKALKSRVSDARGLTFLADVPVLFEAKESFTQRLKTEIESGLGEKKREHLSLAYGKLGLLPRGVDLKGRLLNYYSSQALGFYSSRAKTIVLLANPPNAADSSLDDINSRTVVHELAHALQDQHFAFAAKLRQAKNGDQILALRSVAEADAILSEYAYLFGGLEDGVPEYALRAVENEPWETLSPSLPAVIADQMRFQYASGLKFILRFIGGRGWTPVNLIYSNPPLSTEQILHPEKYLGMPDPPLQISLKNVTDLFSAEWREIENDTLGELMVHCLFTQFLGPTYAAAVASGWGGDHLVAFQRGNEVAFIWAITWDSAQDADEFFAGYRRIIPMKYQTLDRDRLYTEKRDRTVLIVEGLERHHVQGFVENVWRSMEIKEPVF